MIIYHSREQRAQVFKRDSGVCNHCGKSSGRWDVDHIKPLVEQKGVSEDNIDWTYYAMENLQTLCKKCHKAKSKSETHLRSNVKDKRLKSRGIGRYNHKKFIGDTGRYNINKFIEEK
jgi:5-methylcytosine-specific restriction endonuclease McrA